MTRNLSELVEALRERASTNEIIGDDTREVLTQALATLQLILDRPDALVGAMARAVRDASACGYMIDGERTFCHSCDCPDVARAALTALAGQLGKVDE